MGSRQPPFERSSSNDYIDETQLSFNKLEAQRWDRALESSQRALDQSMDSFCNYSPPILNHSLQEPHDSSESTIRGGGGGTAFQSPASDTTVKLSGYRALERSSAYTFFPTPYNVAATSEIGAGRTVRSQNLKNRIHSRHLSFASVAVDSPLQTRLGGPVQILAREGIYNPRAIWSSPAQVQNQESEGSARSQLSSNKATFGSSALLQSSFPIPRNMSLEEMIVPRGPNLHQRRLDARVSSSPGIPSPLGRGRMREQLHEGEVRGVSLSPVPNGRLHTSDQMKYGRANPHDREMKGIWQNTPSLHSLTVERYASSSSMDPPMFDVYPRNAEIDDAGNLTLGRSPYSNGSGHARKQSDPFVDHKPFEYSTGSTTRMCGVSAPFLPPGTRPPPVHPSMHGVARPSFHNPAGIQMCGSNSGISFDPRSPQFVGLSSAAPHTCGSNSGITFEPGSQPFTRPPFVETRMCGASLPMPSPSETRMCGNGTPFISPSQAFVPPPRTPFTATWPTSAPATSGFATPVETEGSRSARETGFHARLPIRSNLPIPPPPLSSIEGQCEHTPEARARLDAQNPIREAWIREEASKIAQLARLRHAMEKRYQETRSDKDYEAWLNLQAAYDDATNLEKRQEERRNLFLKHKKMKALKTDSVEDMSLANRDSAGVDGEEKLLGYKMALMERTCAEVKPDEDAEAITAGDVGDVEQGGEKGYPEAPHHPSWTKALNTRCGLYVSPFAKM